MDIKELKEYIYLLENKSIDRQNEINQDNERGYRKALRDVLKIIYEKEKED